MTKLSDNPTDGAIVTMPDGYRAIVADYGWNGKIFWWHEAFGREHIIEATVESGDAAGVWRTYSDPRRATVGSLEGDEDQEIWTAWQDFLQTPAGQDTAENIAAMRRAALNQK